MKHFIFTFFIFLLMSCGSKTQNTARAVDTSGTPPTTTTTTDTYTGSVISGNVTITTSPSSTAQVGGTILLYAAVTGITDPSYDFVYVSGYSQSVTASQNGNIASITSGVASTLVIGVNVTSLSNSSLKAYNEITLQFGAGSTTTTGTTTTSPSLTCLLGDTSASRSSVRKDIYFFITTNTGEQLKIVSWDPGEIWDTVSPSFPLALTLSAGVNYFHGYYSSPGVKNIRIIAESVSRPGVLCNGGAVLTDTLTINY